MTHPRPASDDWRVRVTFDSASGAHDLSRRLEAMRVARDERARLGNRVVVTVDGPQLFIYAATERDARLAEQIAHGDLQADHWPASVELTRWHEVAQDWEPADRPLPQTDEDRAAERARLMARQDEESVEQGFPDWEVRVELPSHREARELGARLEREGVPYIRRWRYVVVSANNEDAAHRWAEQLRRESPPQANIRVEGTFPSIQRHNPFAVFSAMGGGV